MSVSGASNYTHLGIDFVFNVAWDMHIRKVLSEAHCLNEDLGIEMVELNIHCVVLSVRVYFMCYGSVLVIAFVGIIFRKRSNNC